jgi:hypothetical protein
VYGFQGMGPNGYEDWFESIEEMAANIQQIVKINLDLILQDSHLRYRSV